MADSEFQAKSPLMKRPAYPLVGIFLLSIIAGLLGGLIGVKLLFIEERLSD